MSQDNETKNAVVEIETGGDISPLVPQSFSQVWRMSTIMHGSGMCPKSFDNPEKVMGAMIYGMEIGLTPFASVQSIAVINGRPSIWGDAALALVQSSGKAEYVSEWIEGTGDGMIAYCETKRKGEPKEHVVTFSVDDARRAGLWQDNETVKRRDKYKGGMVEVKNDSPWYRYPKRMLQMRARSFCLRDKYPDVLKGIKTVEENRDIPEGEYEETGGQRLMQSFKDNSAGITEGHDNSRIDAVFNGSGEVVEAEVVEDAPAPNAEVQASEDEAGANGTAEAEKEAKPDVQPKPQRQTKHKSNAKPKQEPVAETKPEPVEEKPEPVDPDHGAEAPATEETVKSPEPQTDGGALIFSMLDKSVIAELDHAQKGFVTLLCDDFSKLATEEECKKSFQGQIEDVRGMGDTRFVGMCEGVMLARIWQINNPEA